MYLSRLTLNPRHLTVLRALSDLYVMHRLLWQAFPDLAGTRDNLDRERHMHPLLYRVEPISRDGLVRVLAQSEAQPDWNSLPDASRLVCSAEYREYAPKFSEDQWLRYRLRANPVVNWRQEGKKRGQRQGLLTEPEQAAWLERQGKRFGFALPEWDDREGNFHPDIRIVSQGIVKGFKAQWHPENSYREPPAISLLCVDYEGLLRVTNPMLLEQALRRGIGPAKGLGFGLLSVLRVTL